MLDAVIAELERVNEVLRWTVVAAGAACFALGCVVAWLEAKLENGCERCTHCEFERRKIAQQHEAARHEYEHRNRFHAEDCDCPRGGPPRPRS